MSIPGNVSEVLSKSPNSKVGGGSGTERQWYELATKEPKRQKYNAKATSVDGIRFDSKREAAHYSMLKFLHQAGQIRWFAIKPVFVLPGGVKYIPDFVVQFHDRLEIQDVKGVRTQSYVIKRRQMKAVYGIEVVEI